MGKNKYSVSDIASKCMNKIHACKDSDEKIRAFREYLDEVGITYDLKWKKTVEKVPLSPAYGMMENTYKCEVTFLFGDNDLVEKFQYGCSNISSYNSPSLSVVVSEVLTKISHSTIPLEDEITEEVESCLEPPPLFGEAEDRSREEIIRDVAVEKYLERVQRNKWKEFLGEELLGDFLWLVNALY